MNPVAFIVFVETPSDFTMIRCYRDSEFDASEPGAWERAVNRMQALCGQKQQGYAWIETCYKLPFVLLNTRYTEVHKPE